MKPLDGISIIIPTWNKKDLIVSCLQILDKILVETVKIPVEIIAVENGSTDGSLQALQKLKIKSKLTVMAMDVNLGFSRAINLAAKTAKYNYLYLMNNDMQVQRSTFTALVQFVNHLLALHKPFLAIASQVFFVDKNKPRSESGKTYCFTRFGLINIRHMVNPHSLKNNSLTLYAGGGSSLFNKELFLKLGGFDHRRFQPMYAEDLDLGVTGWECGCPSYFCADSNILHYHRASSSKWKVDPDKIIKKNFRVFMLKHWHQLRRPLLKNFVQFELHSRECYL